MKTTLVYRIEDKTGCGPFAGSKNICDEHYDLFESVSSSKPLPSQEGFKLDLNKDERLVCGTSSLELLKEWFPYECISILDNMDFALVTYSIEYDPKIVEHRAYQSVFVRELATCVSHVPVYELYSYEVV